MAGRKSLKDEIKIIERLTALSEPTFKYIEGLYLAGEKEDKKWAVEQMMKLYSKCIPTEITGENGEALKIQIISYGHNDSVQLAAGDTPATDTPKPEPVQSDSMAPESAQDDAGNK